MEKYNHKTIEKKWQAIWEAAGMYRAEEDSLKPKQYVLDMFPYPSGDGLHMGHTENYTATCIYSRYLRMKGLNVLHPIGWDAFGMPSENYAIKTGVHPNISTHQNIKNFIIQMKSLGLSFDWTREIDTSSPEYYKWTQWFFLLLYKNGLAYKKKAKANWCESCKTVLANEQAEGGICERCKNEVVQKDLEQWFFKITDFAEDLINDLDTVDWPASSIVAQRNWIGRSEGVLFKMEIEGSEESIVVYTTRIDTVFGMTYVVLAPEHPLIQKLHAIIRNNKEVRDYINETKKKTELERTELAKEKTGVKILGIFVISPFTGNRIPVFVADYVLGNYGTGAVMAVPAHDERDFEFAKKYNLPIAHVIAPRVFLEGEDAYRPDVETLNRRVVDVILENERGQFLLVIENKKDFHFIGGGVEDGETDSEAVFKETKEESGYTDIEIIGNGFSLMSVLGFRHTKQKNQDTLGSFFHAKLKSKNKVLCEIDEGRHEIGWFDKDKIIDLITWSHHKTAWCNFLNDKNHLFTDDGIVMNSGNFDGLSSPVAREKMAKWLEKKGIGAKKVNYRLRDWLVSRQRYWGAPIPIIYCDDCGEVPVPEKDLPVKLPTDVNFLPTGESPLKYSKSFNQVLCPKCDKNARREPDTMDTFVCSSWYYLRYIDPHNSEKFASQEELKKWLPVGVYMGGAEHIVLHLMYARFFAKVLKKTGLVDFNEPFLRLRHQGMVLASDGRKMSKSLGNVVNPNEVMEKYGADTLRLHIMFLGPLEDMKAWNEESIAGPHRFLERVWRLRGKISQRGNEHETEQILNKTIKKVGEDIETFSFNTAISALMMLLNDMEKKETITRATYETFLILLAPFAPHITEEIWHEMGNKQSIHLASWPAFDSGKIIVNEVSIAVQVNGKVRDTVIVSLDNNNEETVLGIASIRPDVARWILGKKIKRVIFVPGRILNIVV